MEAEIIVGKRLTRWCFRVTFRDTGWRPGTRLKVLQTLTQAETRSYVRIWEWRERGLVTSSNPSYRICEGNKRDVFHMCSVFWGNE